VSTVDLFLFRHSHVDYIPPAQITAHNPLTPLGHEMAARLAERCDDWDLQFLFNSTMLRARQTADAISACFPNLPRIEMPEFEETSITDLEGFPGELPVEDLTQWEDAHYAYANEHMWARVECGLEKVRRIIEERGLERVAIVAHGGSINVVLRHFMGSELQRLRTCWFDLDWTATSCLRYNETLRWVRWVNDARHIDDLRHRIPVPPPAE
jgi:broad specificity phosphatase PhoE